MIYGTATIIAAAVVAIRFWNLGHRLSPDGQQYLMLARGEAVSAPFTRRWLLPHILGTKIAAWQIVTYSSLVICGPLIAAYVPGEPWQKLAAVLLLVGLPGLYRINVLFPVLTDAPAFALALAGAVAWRELPAPLNYVVMVGLAALAGATKEAAPVFMAIFAWNPLPLLGLLTADWRTTKSSKVGGFTLRVAIQDARGAHAGRVFDWKVMLLPWGAVAPLALIGAAHAPPALTLPAAIASLVGYGQLVQASDRARLFSWAAPPVICLAVLAVPEALAPLLLLHLFNPTDGT